MTRIFLVRHAEAEGNMYRRIHGHYDSMLTPRGERQLAALEMRFKDVNIDAVYSSDLTRTQLTAGAIARPRGLCVKTDPDLRELNFGVWEDCAWGDVARDYPEQLQYLNAGDARFLVEKAESFARLRERMVGAVERIAAENEGASVAVVAHGTCLRELLLALTDSPLAAAHSDNTAVSLLERDAGQWRLVYANDNSHLTEELSTLAGQNWWREENRGREDTADINLSFRPMDMKKDAELFEACRREAWRSIYGGMDGYSELYTPEVVRRAVRQPDCVALAYAGERPCGIIELNYSRERREKAGCISFLYLEPEFRGRGLGVQLIGYATSWYRGHGRDKLRLRVAEVNTAARKLYEKYGFEYIGGESGTCGLLLVMEKNLRTRLL